MRRTLKQQQRVRPNIKSKPFLIRIVYRSVTVIDWANKIVKIQKKLSIPCRILDDEVRPVIHSKI